jgi:hypothetical protein
MPVSDLDIARTAHQWISLHGDNATARAREMVEAMRKKGDEDGPATSKTQQAWTSVALRRSVALAWRGAVARAS